MTKYSKATMNSIAKTVRNNLKKYNKYPSTVTAKDMDGKKHELSIKQVHGLFEAQYIFWIKNGRQPNFVTYHSTASNPLVMDYQSYSMSCCPTSLSMASQLLYNYKTENKCIKELGTKKTTTGTSPSQLINNAPKLGFKVAQIPRNKQAVTNSLKLKKPVIMHIQTKPAKCLGYTGDYGHFILCYGIDGDYYKLADPTKGLKKCKCSTIDKATDGRKIYYYSVALK